MTVKPIGQYWEQRAEHFLLQNGLQLIARNFSTSSGEIDLIMRDGEHVAFIEVRYRRSNRLGGAKTIATAVSHFDESGMFPVAPDQVDLAG